MSAIEAAGGLAGGVGLYLLGQALATEGVALAGGLELRQNLARWAREPRRGLRTGAAAALLVPASHALNAAAIGLVNTGLVGAAAALWLAIGVTAGTAMAAWTAALVGFQPWLQAAALSAIGLGAFVRWSMQKNERAAWGGQVLLGMGVLLLGVHALGESFARASGEVRLDSWAPGGLVGPFVWIVPGVALTALLRSPSLVVVSASLAAAAGALGLPAAAFLSVGALLGSGTAAGLVLWKKRGTAAARRIALGQLAFLGLATVAALLVLPVALSFAGAPRGDVALIVLGLLQTLVLAVALVAAVPLARPALAFLSERFLLEEHVPSRPDHVDACLTAVPDLAVPALTRETARIAGLARELSKKALVDGGLTELRLAAFEQATGNLSSAVEESTGCLRRNRLPAHVSDALAALQRALVAERRIIGVVSSLPLIAADPEASFEQVMRSRLRQVHFSLLHLLEGLERVTESAGREHHLEDEAGAIEVRVGQLEDRLLDAVAAGETPAARVKPLLDHLGRLRLIAESASEAAAALTLCLPRPRATAAEAEESDLEPAYATVRSR